VFLDLYILRLFVTWILRYAAHTQSSFGQLWHITLRSSSNVNIVEWLMSFPAVRLFVGSALTIFFGLGCRDYTFDRSAFNVLFQKV